MLSQDFFELEEHDIEDMGLADRINIHYKIGNFEKVSFESDEEYFVNKAFKTETFQDVLELSVELYITCSKVKRNATKLDDLEFEYIIGSGSGMGR